MVLLCIGRYFYELVGTSENSDGTADFSSSINTQKQKNNQAEIPSSRKALKQKYPK